MIELASLTPTKDKIRILKHDLHYVREESRDKEGWMQKARRLFGDSSFEDLVEKVENATEKDVLPLFEGREIGGIFSDIHGTLIQEGRMNQELINELKSKSAESPVRIWTDGDTREVAQLFRREGLMWPVLSKAIFKGSTVAEAYDDMEEGEFGKRYNINVGEYHQVGGKEDLREETPGLSRI